jgi:copper chaperone CopZ
MKRIISFVILIGLLSSPLYGCEGKIKNAKTVTFKVYGNCEMCKETIEEAAFKNKEAKVDWDVNSKLAKITFDSTKTNLNAVLKRIAQAGYDSDVFLASESSYNSLPQCCKYDRPVKKEIASPTEVAIVKGQTDSSKANSLQAVYDAYFDLKDALIKSDATIVATKAATLLKAINAIKMETLGSNHMAFMNVEKDLKLHSQHISESKEIDHQRDHFSALSTAIYPLIKIAKANTTVYYDYCPMYNNGKGANWLSKEVEIKNPYFGSMMLNCGKVQETIK